MSDTQFNTFGAPSSAPSSTPKAPDLEGQVRGNVIEGIEGAIELPSTQPQGGGQGDDTKPVVVQKKEDTTAATTPVTSGATPFGDVKNIPEDTLLRLTRKKIMGRLAALDLMADKIIRGNSKSRAFNLTQVVSEMRKLHISMQSLYRMAVERVRELYAQVR